MSLFFVGFLFVFLDYKVAFGTVTVNFIPAFVGYALILWGALKMRDKSRRFSRVGIASFALLLWSIAVFVMDLFAVSFGGTVQTVISLAVTLALLYMAYELCEGVKEIERRLSRPIGAQMLSSAWFLLSIGNLIYCFSEVVPSILLPCLILRLLSVIWFEMGLYQVGRRIKLHSPRRS